MTQTRFRITIDGSWSAKDMADLFQSCDTLYRQLANLHSRELFRAIQNQTDQPKPTGNSDGREKALKVISVSYCSPGWADFLGAGELVGHLKELLLGLFDRVIERKDREQSRALRSTEIEAAILENYSKRIELIDQAMDISNRSDLNDAQRQQILTYVMTACRPLGNAVADGRILGIEDLPDEK